MSVDGSRLPAVNWRPTRTAGAASVAVAVLATLALSAVVGAPVPTLVGLLAGLCVAGAVWAAAVAERRVATLAAGALATAGGVAAVAALLAAVVTQTAWPPTPPLPFLAFAPFALAVAGGLAGFGALASLWSVSPGEGAGVAVRRLAVVWLVPAAALALEVFHPPLDPAFELFGLVADAALAREGPVVRAGTAGPRVTGFLLLVSVAAVAVRAALGRLPLVELADERRRDAVAAAVGRSRRVLGVLALLGGALGVVGVAVGPERYAALSPALRWMLIAVTTSTGLRWALVAVALAGTVGAVVPRAVRAAASDRFRPGYLPVASLLAGGLLVAAVVPLHAPLGRLAVERASSEAGRRFLLLLFESLGSFAVVTGVVVLGLTLAGWLLLAVWGLGGLGFLEESTGVQLASAGVLVAAVAAAIGGAHLAVVVGGVAASLLVWDLGEFAATMGAELGRDGRTRRGELVHAGGGVLLAGLGGLVALGVAVAVDVVPSHPTPVAVLVAAAAVFGTVLLFLVSR